MAQPPGAPHQGKTRYGRLDEPSPPFMRWLLAIENRFQWKAWIEMIRGQPVAIEER